MPPNHELDSLSTILRALIREEIDRTPGFRELTGRSALPANVEAEKAILGAILLGESVKPAEIDSECFSLGSHRHIWLAMVALNEAGKPVDLITLQEHMGEIVKKIGGVAYLASLTEDLPRRPQVGEYIRIVKEKARLRQIIAGCQESIKAAQEQIQTSSEIVATLGIALKGIRKESK